MSLDFNLTEIEFFKNDPSSMWVKVKESGSEYEDVNVETKSLIFGCMAVGLNGITKTNLAEWWSRWKVLEKFEGHYLYGTPLSEGKFEKVCLTPEVLIKHIGLGTNVSNVTTSNWVSRLKRNSYSNEIKSMNATAIRGFITVYKYEFNEAFNKLKTEEEIEIEKGGK